MSSRYTRSGLRAVVVLSVLLPLLVALGAGPTNPPAGASTAATLTLLHQTPEVIQPGSSALSLELGVGSSVPAGAVVELTLYNKLTSRSLFEQSLNTLPGSGATDDTFTAPLTQLGSGSHGGRLLTVPVTTTAADCGAPTSLDLACNTQSNGNTGVYPLSVALQDAKGGTVLGRFTTYLTYADGAGQPLRVALVLPLSAPVVLRSRPATPARALGPSSSGWMTAIRNLIGVLGRGQFSSVSVTLEVSPQTLQNLDQPAVPGDIATLTTLRDLSVDQQIHEIPSPSYVPVDLGALAGAGEGTEVDAQMREGSTVLKSVGVGTTPGSETWVANGPVGSSIGAGLSQVAKSLNVGTVRLVLPESSVTLPSQALTWASTFPLNVGRTQPIEAVEADTQLTKHFVGSPGDPALEAQQLLADLAVVHSEAPNLNDTRGMVAVPPAGWAPDAAFAEELLGGLIDNPVVQPVTLDGLFAQVTPFAPSSQTSSAPHLSSDGSALERGLAHQITSARLRLTGFDNAIGGRTGTPPAAQLVLTQLDQALLASQSSQLSGAKQRDGVSTFDWALNSQLRLIQISSERTITLTARNGLLPVTLLSSAPYPVRGILTLQSSKLTFPNGASQHITLDRSTNSFRIPVVVRTSGDLPVTATFSSPKEGLTITRATMTIRSTATSLVGILLTVAALVVLLAWWARTVVAGRRRRRAAAAAQEPGR